MTKTGCLLLALVSVACVGRVSGSGGSGGDGGGGDTGGTSGDTGNGGSGAAGGASGAGGGGTGGVAPCLATEPHALVRCNAGDAYWYDDCGAPTDLETSCAGAGCSAGQCVVQTWHGFGGSEFGPYGEEVNWGSASGYGVSGPDSYGAEQPVVRIDALGRIVVSWSGQHLGITQVYVTRWNGSAWEDFAGSSTGSGVSQSAEVARLADLALDALGNPAVAWVEYINAAYQPYFKRWNGTAWEALGGSTTGFGVAPAAGDANYVSLALSSAGDPVISWHQDYFGAQQVYFVRWSGLGWEQLDGSASTTGISNAPSSVYPTAVAVDSADRPHVAWCQGGAPYLRVWTGAVWDEIGGSATGTGIDDDADGCSDIDLEIDAAVDQPLVAWQSNGEVYLRRWSGTAWDEIGLSASGTGLSDSGGYAGDPALALQANGDPTVLWRVGQDGVYSLHVARWTGSAWEVLDGAAPGGVSGDSTVPLSASLALDADDHPVVAWEEHGYYPSSRVRAFLRAYDGVEWRELGDPAPQRGGLSDNPGSSRGPSLVLDAAELPVVAWFDNSSLDYNVEIYLKRFDGLAWIELDGSATDVGLSDTAGSSYYPDVALDLAGNPVVAWSDDTSGNEEIYLKRWTGAAWEELGGSATGGGISNDPDRSVSAHLKIDANDRPVVAWVNDALDGTRAYLRRWNGLTWEELAGSATGAGIDDRYSLSIGLDLTPVGHPVVALGGVTAFAWNGVMWDEVGLGYTPSAAGFIYVSGLAVDALGRGTVVWSGDNEEIYASRYIGSVWTALGESLSASGLSNTAGRSFDPEIALDALGRPVVAWNDTSDGNNEVFLRRFDGVAWEDALGSAAGGGLSNQTVDAYSLALAASATRICVAWEGLAAVNMEIAMRCLDLAP